MSWQFDLDAPPGQMVRWVSEPSVESATETTLLAGPPPGPPPAFELEEPPRLRFGAGAAFATAKNPAEVSAELAQRLARHRDRLDQLEDELGYLLADAVDALQRMEGP